MAMNNLGLYEYVYILCSANRQMKQKYNKNTEEHLNDLQQFV